MISSTSSRRPVIRDRARNKPGVLALDETLEGSTHVHGLDRAILTVRGAERYRHHDTMNP